MPQQNNILAVGSKGSFNTDRPYGPEGQIIDYEIVKVSRWCDDFVIVRIAFDDKTRRIDHHIETMWYDEFLPEHAAPALQAAIMKEYDHCRYLD